MPSIVSTVLNKHSPSTWSHTTEDAVLVPVFEYTAEYDSVANKIIPYLPKQINRIVRVENPYLWGCYLLKKEEYLCSYPVVQERRLFHATGANNIMSIIGNNFDWRRVKRSRYGRGVSFSPMPDYANTHCNENVGSQRAMIIASILVGRATTGGYGTKIPPTPFDTTVRKNSNVYVKYYDNEFYPEYVAYYTN